MIKLRNLILEDKNADVYESVKQYQNGYTVTSVQRYLRKKRQIDIPEKTTLAEYKQFLQTQVDNIDLAIASSKTYPVGTIFWRGVDSNSFYKDNKTTDLGYTSVAINNNEAVRTFGLGGIIMKLIVGEPIKGLDMNKYLRKSDIDGEYQQEILLERGLSFILEKEDKLFNTYRIIK